MTAKRDSSGIVFLIPYDKISSLIELGYRPHNHLRKLPIDLDPIITSRYGG